MIFRLGLAECCLILWKTDNRYEKWFINNKRQWRNTEMRMKELQNSYLGGY